ncbi:MAG: [protein-PII] uridylyltransferase [Gammaproteobacteria bacterium]|nr:[protein-PII] uridylyltransferase [Gammaproteobacteria bacterium]MBU1414953.1 [protein-PII] uridylyltransferase [Gammaproteobacteria bacterium]
MPTTSAVKQALDTRALIADTRAALNDAQQQLRDAYERTGSAVRLLHGRARLVDRTLRDIWRKMAMPDEIAMVAVGGYGRGELFPASDVDLLFLVPEGCDATHHPRLEPLIGVLWDIGLDIGHSVRTIAECLETAEQDITIQTTLIEARYLCGNRKLFDEFDRTYHASLDPVAFLKAKQLEQAERHSRFNDTPYSLEPNCKEHPGGLRDLQIILWIALAAHLGRNWRDLAQTVLVTRDESRQLMRAESFLRHLRIRLHHVANRREDRLSFEFQEALAKSFGIEPTETKRASEVLMQRYYRNAKLVTQLNALVLQNINASLAPSRSGPPIIIDEHFQTVRDLLDIRRDELFEEEPLTILEAFLLMARRPELHGMTARTLRSLWHARRGCGRALRRHPRAPELFLQLFAVHRGLILTLRRMNQYGILGQYLPAFGRIVGQMQHDLFHVYTVDQHILQVIRNLQRFSVPEFAHEYPFCTRLITGFDRPWLIYVAALFHDIAKGRGGDHSRLGMADARRFCRQHAIEGEDEDLIVFLVEQHLTMSQVAQKQDLADPQIIRDFAALVATERRLTALYLLTIADIRGTSPKVWNTWKGKLLEDLFRATAQLLRGDLPPQMAGVPERQDEARRLLRLRGMRPDIEAPLWEHLDTGYFLRHDADEIAWHTRTLYYRPDSPEPVVRARINPTRDGVQVMVYLADQPDLFARICGFFARRGMSIADAKVHTTRHNYALDSFMLLVAGETGAYRDITGLIEHDLAECLTMQQPLEAPPSVRLSRQVKHFPIDPEVEIRQDDRGNQYIMSIAAADRPGLLYAVARILSRYEVVIHSAKISTLGERVEDTFLISGAKLGKMVALVHLEQDLLAALQV